MSKYGTGKSSYCYPETEILINHFDIKNEIRLMQMDAMLTSKRLSELQIEPLEGDFSFSHLKEVHYYIFQDIYPFAGEVRTENISKGGFTFAPAIHINESAGRLFEKLRHDLNQKVDKEGAARLLAYYLAEINVLHPFRDGNGRSCREFIRLLARHYGFYLDWTKKDKDTILQASIQSTTDLEPLVNVMNELITEKMPDCL